MGVELNETVTIQPSEPRWHFSLGRFIIGSLAYLGLVFFASIAFLMLLVYGIVVVWRNSR